MYQVNKLLIKKNVFRNFPGGPMVKTLPSNAVTAVSSLAGELGSQMLWAVNKNENMFLKDL